MLSADLKLAYESTLLNRELWFVSIVAVILFASMFLTSMFLTQAFAVEGQFEEIIALPEHISGKVKLTVYVDFYCPHCKTFDEDILPQLKGFFGDYLVVETVAIRVVGKSSIPFEMYEYAKRHFKGEEMKGALFRTIHGGLDLENKRIQEKVFMEVGLPLASMFFDLDSENLRRIVDGNKAIAEFKVIPLLVPTVVLNGNLKAKKLDSSNLKTLICNILKEATLLTLDPFNPCGLRGLGRKRYDPFPLR